MLRMMYRLNRSLSLHLSLNKSKLHIGLNPPLAMIIANPPSSIVSFFEFLVKPKKYADLKNKYERIFKLDGLSFYETFKYFIDSSVIVEEFEQDRYDRHRLYFNLLGNL